MDRIVDMTSQPMRRMSARAMVHVDDGELEFSVRGLISFLGRKKSSRQMKIGDCGLRL
jgi:hypothetical protein